MCSCFLVYHYSLVLYGYTIYWKYLHNIHTFLFIHFYVYRDFYTSYYPCMVYLPTWTLDVYGIFQEIYHAWML